MAGGGGLFGGGVEAPRKRGRPKGSTNRRSKDLKGLFDARYGGSAAQQSAALCMVTPAELKAAGGSMARAQVNKALDLVKHVRDAKDRLDGELRALVREAVEDLVAAHAAGLDAQALRAFVSGFVHRIQHLGGDFGLAQAMKLITEARADLLPYTDQRQPQAVELTVPGMAPSVVVMGAEVVALAPGLDVENVGEFEGFAVEVSRPKSHDASQAVEILALPPPEAAD